MNKSEIIQGMERDEGLKLLRDAGVPEERIDADAITIACVVGGAVVKHAAKKLAQSIVNDILSEEKQSISPEI